MSLKTKCPHCGVVIGLKDKSVLGRKIKCVKCETPFEVEPIEEGAAVKKRPQKSASAAKKKKRPKPAPVDDDDWGMPSGGAAPPVMMPPRVQGVKSPPPKKNDEAVLAEAAAQSEGNSKKTMLIAGSCVGGLLLITGIIFAVGSMGGGASKSKEPAAPLEFTKGTSKESMFSVEYPVGWEFSTGGGSGGVPEWIRIKTDDISVSLKETISGSAIGDISGAGVQGEELPDELSPVFKVHEWIKMKDMETEMNSYEEEYPTKIETGTGEGRLSKFKGDRGLLSGGTAYGLRATIKCSPEYLKVVCICESRKGFERNEETLKKMILSVGRR